jgi:phospholipase C
MRQTTNTTSQTFGCRQSTQHTDGEFPEGARYPDGHAGYSNPLDEQIFLVNTVNALKRTDEWKETAIIILYDDSDGWYDHVMGPIVNQSNVTDDQVLGAGNCGTPKAIDTNGTIQNALRIWSTAAPSGDLSLRTEELRRSSRDRPRASVLRFIEDNWSLDRIGNGSTDAIAGRLNGMLNSDTDHRAPRVFLDPATGTVLGE